jgi:hypothetical protein
VKVPGDDLVTLGEVNRNVTSLRGDVRELVRDVTDLKVSTRTQGDKTARLERVVYGALATGVTGVITAVFSVVGVH